MKRLISLAIALMLLLCFAAAEAPTATPAPQTDSVIEGYAMPAPVPTPELPPLRDDPVIANIVEIAHRIDQLAESEMYMRYLSMDEAVWEMAEKISAGDHTQPVRAYHLSGQELIAALYAGAPAEQIPDFTRFELARDLVDELPSILWGTREDLEINLLNHFARYKIFPREGASGCGLFVLLYREAAPVVIPWVAENGVMKLSAFFMPDETLADASGAEDVAEWFAGIGMPAVRFEEVPLT